MGMNQCKRSHAAPLIPCSLVDIQFAAIKISFDDKFINSFIFFLFMYSVGRDVCVFFLLKFSRLVHNRIINETTVRR